ncbi:hypothetical protein LJC33_06190 [Eubacteriales bacterium OttesenSCG-928-N13]|nr:hypothetical protein [Eubacteriales bacterium OttesenSCG-928-N13]
MSAWLEAMTGLERVFAYVAIAGSVALLIQFILQLIGIGHTSEMGSAELDHDGFDAGDMDHDGIDHVDFDHVDFDHGDFDHVDFDHDGFDHDGHDHAGMMHARDVLDGHHPHSQDGSADADLRPFTLRGIIAFLAVGGWGGLILLKAGIMAPIATLLAIGMGAITMLLMALAIRAMIRLQQDGSMDIRNALGLSASVYITIPPNRSGRGKVTLLLQERLVELDAVTDQSDPIPTGTQVFISDVSSEELLVVEPESPIPTSKEDK